MRKHVDGAAVAIMVTLCLMWATQQVAIKAVAGDVTPMLQVALRSGGAAALVWLVNRFVLRERWLPGIALRSGLVVGALFALEFLFVAEGLRWTSASHIAVLLYTAPMFAAIGLHLKLPDERLGGIQWGGIGLAFVGIAIAFLGPALMGGSAAPGPDWMLGDFMGLCGGAAWGMTTVAVRTTRLSDAPATQTLFCQLACAFVLLLPVAFVTGQTTFHLTPFALASLGFQTVVVTFASYLVWFWMLRRYYAARLGVLSFMTPLFGVALGVALLHERVDAAFLAGSALVLAGLLIVNGQAVMRQVFMRGGREQGGARV